jgi:hypothetical protein
MLLAALFLVGGIVSKGGGMSDLHFIVQIDENGYGSLRTEGYGPEEIPNACFLETQLCLQFCHSSSFSCHFFFRPFA